jgi:multidrug efflux system outer membrane protein
MMKWTRSIVSIFFRLDKIMRLTLISFLTATGLAGCASAPPEVPAELPVTPAAFKQDDGCWIAATPAEPQPRGTWWKAFPDPVLHDLVERAGHNNTSIQLAAARLAQAKAMVHMTNANQSVQADLAAGASRQGGPLINAAGADGTLLNAAVNLSYEVDLFGRLAKETGAASLNAQAREALLQSTRLLVQADVAQTYFALRGLDAERAMIRATAYVYRDMLRLTERRLKAGYAADLEVARLRAEAAATDAEALATDRRRAELEHALALMLGEVASSFRIDETDWTMPLPRIPAGIPSTLLTRRPDISAAQRFMLAAQARLGAARLAWFPNLMLTASGGYASPELGNLFTLPMRAWGVASLLALPLFDGGRREAAEQSAAADLQAALASYREQILIAFKDVEDQLSSLRLLADQAEVQNHAVTSTQHARALVMSQYRNGLVSQLDSLVAHRDEFRIRRQALQVRSAQYQVTVALVRALGGGWEPAETGHEAAPGRTASGS